VGSDADRQKYYVFVNKVLWLAVFLAWATTTLPTHTVNTAMNRLLMSSRVLHPRM
jgi:hypothetical protein